jgi:glycosyltransferase involved in cell wall biosynthesis
LFEILRLTKYRKILKKFENYNAVYLFDNYYSSLFSRKSIIIGSNHCAFDNPNSLRQNLFAKLISLRLIYPSIGAMHLFPQNVSLKRYFGNKPIILLSNGVDTDLYYPQNNKNSRTRILFVGRLEESKGILMVLKVYDGIKKIFPAELIIVGSGNLETEVDKVCINDSNVKHFKHLSEKDLAIVYRSCDILLYPTQADSYPLVVLEALSSGLKVVTANFLYRIYDDFIKYNAIKFVDFDEKSLIDALIDMKDKDIDKNVIHYYIEKNYSWKIISEKLFDRMHNMSIKEKDKNQT